MQFSAYFEDTDDDSEDEQYPVPRLSADAQWMLYEEETKRASLEAASIKAEQIRKAGASNAISSQNYNQTMADLDALFNDMYIAKDVQAAEDRTRALAFDQSNDQILRTIEETVKQVVASEERARALAKADQERAKALQERAAAAEREAEIARHKAEEEKKERQARIEAMQEERAKRTEEAAKEAEEQKTKEALALANTAQAESLRNKADLEAFKLSVTKLVSEQPTLKNFCARARLKLNPKVGQVTTSLQQIKAVCAATKTILEDARAQDPTELLALRWCLNFLSKAMIKQAEREVSVKPTAAYPLGMFAITLMRDFPEFRDILMRRLYKNCPWAVPYVNYDMSTESGRKNLGYKQDKNEHWEQDTVYLERQNGIFSLFAAIVSFNFSANPCPITLGWRWLARILNSTLGAEQSDVACATIATFLDIAGKTFVQRFGAQGAKLARTTLEWAALQPKSPAGSRLMILLEEYSNSGVVGLAMPLEA